MVDDYHIPVMAGEAIDLLITDINGCYIDGTLGGGGHTEKILERLSPSGSVIGFDIDIDAINFVKEKLLNKELLKGRLEILNDNFSNIKKRIKENFASKKIKGVLLDLGVSSYQIDEPDKGFAYKLESVLDMRMDKTRKIPAYELLNTASEKELVRIFSEYGEDRNPRALANSIIKRRVEKKFYYSTDLVDLIKSFIGGPKSNKVLSRIFQSLRIEVNNELENLSEGLTQSLEILEPFGRLVVISYHSLEDKMVKDFFNSKAKGCVCPPDLPKCVCGKKPILRKINSKPVMASEEEIERNPRARSARLRAAEKLAA